MPDIDSKNARNKVLLGLTGGVAAYKAAELVRRLGDRGIEVHVVMTEAACGFITPATLQALSGHPVYTSMWDGRISNGMPLVARIALKPIATTLTPQPTVDLATGEAAPTKYERSDFCQVPRAVPIVEAALAIALCDALLEKLGGDSLDELRPRLFALRQMRLSHLPMDGAPWRFGYGS